MKNPYTKFSLYRVLKGMAMLAILFLNPNLWAQTVFSENMGTPSATTAISGNAFQNSGVLSYSNGSQTSSADIRSTSTSSGYSGSSGGGNVYFTSTSGVYGFSIENIDASNYTALSLQYGYKKESASLHATFSVDYWDGSGWTTLANSSSALFNEATNASAVWYAAKTLSLPSDAQINGLKIRFVKTGTVAIRIDDVKLSGTQVLPIVSNTTVANITNNSATFGGNVTSAAGSNIVATGSVYAQTISNSNPLLGGASVTQLSTPSPNTGTGSFSNGSGSALLPNMQYSYNAYATNNSGATGYGIVSTFYTMANVPVAPTVNGETQHTLNVAIGADGNPAITNYAIYETTTAQYVQSNGTLAVNPIFQTATSWSSITLTGLNASTTYTFQVIARNGHGDWTPPGPSSNGTTLADPPSAHSDISFNGGSPTSTNSNIDYILYQGDTLTNTGSGNGGSVGVMGFYLRDGGSGLNDSDQLSTELTSITFNVTNGANIRYARLFVGTSPRGTKVSVDGNSQLVFSGLTDIVALDNEQLAVNLRITFNEQVTDNQQMQFTVASAMSTGSTFATSNAGGAASSTANNYNRIEVTASQLRFAVQPDTFVEKANMTPSPIVEAVDILGNRDLDFASAVNVTSSGVLVVSPQTAVAVAGLAEFPTVNHDVDGTGIILTASATGLSNAGSNAFNIQRVPLFDPIYGYVQNTSMSPLPMTSINGIQGTWSPSLNNMATTTYTFTPNLGQNATTTTMTVGIFESPFLGENAPSAAAFNQSCLINGVIVTCTSETTKNYIPPTNSANAVCSPPNNNSPCASSLTSDITFTFNTPVTSIRLAFSAYDHFQYLNTTTNSDLMKITSNTGGQLTFTNLCGLMLNVWGQLECTLPLAPPNVINAGNVLVTVHSTIPFTSLTIDDQGISSFSTHPCDATNVVVCLAGSSAPILNANTISTSCPNGTGNLSAITASNQPPNTILTWHTTAIANGSSVVGNSLSVGAGTYYAAFYDAAHDCYSPASTAVTVTSAQCFTNLAVTKSVNIINPTAGSNVAFTIVASNSGPSDASGVIVTDVLPSGYSFVSASATTGTWLAPNWTIGNLANGSTATLTIVATVGCGDYLNTAEISGIQIDSNTTDNTSSANVSPTILINAVNDDFSANAIYVCAGGQTTTVFSNDTLSCSSVSASTVTTAIINNGGLIGVTIDSSGIITVPSTASVGTYLITYRICEQTNSSNCDTAIVKVVVTSSINAINDNFTGFPINTQIGGSTNTVLLNDTFNGVAINTNDVTISLIAPFTIPGATINSSGIISVPANTAVGTYVVTYKIVDNTCTQNFDTASVTIYVSPPFISTPTISNSIRANEVVQNAELQSDGKIIISGGFTKYNNIPKEYIARLNTDLTLDQSFVGVAGVAIYNGNPYPFPPLDVKIQADDKIIIVGDANANYGGGGTGYGNGIARLNVDGTYDYSFVTGTGFLSNIVNEESANAIAIQPNGKIIVAGFFVKYNGADVNSIVRLNTDGSLDTSFVPNFTYPGINPVIIHEIALQSDGKIIIAGRFNLSTALPGFIPATVLRLNTNGTIDTSFNPGNTGVPANQNQQGFLANSICRECSSGDYIRKILIKPDGKILLAGAFQEYNTAAKSCIVGLLSDGSIDPNFNTAASGADRVIYDLEPENPLDADSGILFCGEFSTYNGNVVKKMARFESDGSYDPTFSIGSGTLDTGGVNFYNYIRTLKKQGDGKVIVGGNFTSFNGVTAGNITRIQGDNGVQARSSITIYQSEPEIDINTNMDSVKIYPNPTGGIFYVDLRSESVDYREVTLYNILGIEVYRMDLRPNQSNQIDITNLQSGYYIGKISSGQSFKVLKN